jgi:putative membrane protein
LLGLKIGGRVPALIPVSWFLMALPAWVLARAALRRNEARAARIAVAALWLVAWDLALDPAMSFLTPYWVWAESGPYYGMPWVNLLGWYVTGLALMAVIEAFAANAAWDRLSPRWMGAYYAAILLMPLGMVAVAGAWLAVLTTVAAVGACALLSRALAARHAETRPGSMQVAPVEA